MMVHKELSNGCAQFEQPAILLQSTVMDLLQNFSLTTSPGLLDGKLGVAIFLFHFARAYQNKQSWDTAGRLVEEVCHQPLQLGPAYFDGLAGIGSGLEYLKRYRFIDVNTNELLKDIDTELYDATTQCRVSGQDLFFGSSGVGHYFLDRHATLLKTGHNGKIKANQDALSALIDSLESYYFSLPDLLGVITFLARVRKLNVNNDKCQDYFRYALHRVETMLYEDWHFEIPYSCNLFLNVESVLWQAYQKTKDSMVFESWNRLAAVHHSRQLSEMDQRDSDPLKILFQAVVYRQLFHESNIERYRKQYDHHLTLLSNLDVRLFALPLQLQNRPGLIDGCAGAGMQLLAILGKLETDWISELNIVHQLKPSSILS